MPLIGRQRQAYLCEFEASLVYKVSSMTARGTQRNPVSKNKMKHNELITWPWVDHIASLFLQRHVGITAEDAAQRAYLLWLSYQHQTTTNTITVSATTACGGTHPQSQHLETEAEREKSRPVWPTQWTDY